MWVHLSLQLMMPKLQLMMPKRSRKEQELLPKRTKRVPGSGYDLLNLIGDVMMTALYDLDRNLHVARVILRPILLTTEDSVRWIRGLFGHEATPADMIAVPRLTLLIRMSPGVTIGKGTVRDAATIVPLTGTIGTPVRTTRAIVTGGVAAIRSATKRKGADEETARGVIGAAGAEMSLTVRLIAPCGLGGRLTDRVRLSRAIICPKAGVC